MNAIIFGSNFQETRVRPATITLSNNTTVEAVLVEHISKVYTSINNVKRYILSTNLPVVANPIAIIDNKIALWERNAVDTDSIPSIAGTRIVIGMGQKDLDDDYIFGVKVQTHLWRYVQLLKSAPLLYGFYCLGLQFL